MGSNLSKATSSRERAFEREIDRGVEREIKEKNEKYF